jgi:hypothetical protein
VSKTKRVLIGCGLTVGAAAFFLLGMVVSQRTEPRQEPARPGEASSRTAPPQTGRKIFSPSIANDPYAVQQWTQAVEALERQCRDAQAFCEEARNARRQIEEIR